MKALQLLPLRVLSAYARHAPEHPGRWRVVQQAVQRVPALRTAGVSSTVRVRDGFKLIVDGTSQTGRIAYATGRYEPRTTSIIRTLLRPGDTMIDVGANIGYFALVGARAVGPSGVVEAFEPVPDVRRALQANLRLNHVDHVTVHEEALGAATGVLQLFRGPATDTGLTSARPIGSDAISVRQTRFDDLWDLQRRVSLIKIDVEGAELLALEGMRGCLARDHPDVVLEITDEYLRGLGASAPELAGFLLALGYRLWRIPDEGPLEPVRTAEELEGQAQFNALCSARGDLTVNQL